MIVSFDNFITFSYWSTSFAFFNLFIILNERFICNFQCRIEGRTVIKRQVPDSITSWVLTAFAVDNVHGFGLIEEPRKVKNKTVKIFNYQFFEMFFILKLNFLFVSVTSIPTILFVNGPSLLCNSGRNSGDTNCSF